MSDPVGRNRLDEEQSPYLRQHADNPVNWQPWDETALEAAREADKPIFLSIGYSACHWCHVMADESFSDPDIAEVLNEEFVPVKVDREERPDLDRIYQTICQQVTGGGGWPLSVWLTPEGKPFFVGTYFPPEPRRGAPGFRDVVESFAESWRTDRDEIENRADQWTSAITDRLEETPDTPGEAPGSDILDTTVQAALRGADRDHGGFGGDGPKFPQPGRIDALLRGYAVSGRREALDVARQSLDAMANGGLRDHLGGGFHRYCVDREWTVPHFEKMLYDQAGLASRYLDAARLTGNDSYATVAAETFEFVRRELTHDDGGFFATLDAQSGGEEGTFYVWTPADVRDLLPELDADLFCDRYGVTPGGNFEDKTTVLNVSATTADLADEYDLDESEVEDRLEKARKALFAAREGRERPARDEKVLAGWNGLMISAFAQGSVVLEDDSLAADARRALDFVRERLWDDETETLSRRVMNGEVKGDGYLEDYAFLVRGAFDLYQATGDLAPLSFALDLARATRREFYDADAGTLYFTPESGESLVTRPQEPTDQSTPSSLGVATSLFLDLKQFAPDAGFGEVADAVLGSFANRVRGSPLEHVSLALAAEKAASGVPELTVAADEVPDEWRATLASRYLPGLVVSRRPGTDAELDAWLDELGLDEAPPIWAGREAADGEPTVYACENFTCSAPTHDLDEALAWFTAGDDV
ncbi:thioredoxin domain-containing protein [Haloferax volcanii]|uniref:Thioredoxin domain containing protein n=2 Tax=Haloferax volcanii TaxID=2246 RepID=M0ICC6_HALVO|nr:MULTISPECIES: thioredoxin domain-containing protein [Haloferax]ELZ74439.1 thioredoxin domain containing protein [Haloferax lucentense DSM 14919]ELZ93717.1 thioredoxin domain containing protein [Haloferax alexandrinus JCM 10717]